MAGNFFDTAIKSVKGFFVPEKQEPSKQAFLTTSTQGRVVYAGSFDGEKNLGELGPIKYQLMDYIALALRSWQMYIESSEAKTVLSKFCTWVVGVGLKIQCEPAKGLLSKDFDVKDFVDSVESRWGVYAESKLAHYSELESLNKLQHTVYKHSIIGGDVLVICRYVDSFLKIQVVDSFHLRSPNPSSEWFEIASANGNRVLNGVEIDSRGRHIAYYVQKPFDSLNPLNSLDFERVPAVGVKSGMVTAFLVYGDRLRVDNHRGVPLITTILEKLKSVDRYEQATLGSAEEQNKIAYQVQHELGGSGENPFMKQIAKARDIDGNTEDFPTTIQGQALADRVIATTNKQTFNNPPGAKIEPIKTNEAQLYFKDFLDKNIDIMCACIEIPPNVAMSKYDSNYSASRAAIKDWEHTLKVKRKDFSDQFIRPIYAFWLYIEILNNNIQAAGYLLAKMRNDFMVLEAFQKIRCVGAPVANIDPLKEVQAEREKLGITSESIPLTTVEAATEVLNGGESDHNMEQYAEELQKSKDLGLRPEPEVQQQAVIRD